MRHPWCVTHLGSGRWVIYTHTYTYVGFPCGWAGKESACNAGDLGLIRGLGRSPGEGKGYSLQYSGLEHSRDCIVYGIAKSQTQLSDFHNIHIGTYIHAHIYTYTHTYLCIVHLRTVGETYIYTHIHTCIHCTCIFLPPHFLNVSHTRWRVCRFVYTCILPQTLSECVDIHAYAYVFIHTGCEVRQPCLLITFLWLRNIRPWGSYSAFLPAHLQNQVSNTYTSQNS